MELSSMSLEQEVEQQLEAGVKLYKFISSQKHQLIDIAEVILRVFKNGNKILLCGNGGSAADAQHMAGEFVGRFYQERKPLPAIALTSPSVITAIGNDYRFEEIFARQVKALAQQGDAVIGISTSGNSQNVILAMEEAKRCGAVTITLTGNNGQLKSVCDYSFIIPSTDTPRVQEAQLFSEHIICYIVEKLYVQMQI